MLDFDLNEPIIEKDDEPLIAQTFESQEETYIFYNNYAKRHDFVAVKDRTNTKHGRTIRQHFLCHRAGKQLLKVIDMSKTQRKTRSSKCGCPSHMCITLKRRFDIFPEEWHVATFVKEHNHGCHVKICIFFPANRNITCEDEKRIFMYKEARLPIRQIIRVIELEKNLKHGEIPFFDKDIRNCYGKVKRMLGADDAKNLMEYMKLAKEENKMFQYAFTLDEERRLEVKRMLKVLNGTKSMGIVDNHGKAILLGCALLRNETTPTFKWLMKRWHCDALEATNNIPEVADDVLIEEECTLINNAFGGGEDVVFYPPQSKRK